LLKSKQSQGGFVRENRQEEDREEEEEEEERSLSKNRVRVRVTPLKFWPETLIFRFQTTLLMIWDTFYAFEGAVCCQSCRDILVFPE